ncbi:MAG: thioredoxin domain-containing protein [Pyrinomonadaceae bacterium]|nr:thioredoxin domain-containing protein [Pyrinomonadaceae bacterium]MBP9110655.1 thioredoxin domain-containing protein [Pyrinomonadaceae bacterium]
MKFIKILFFIFVLMIGAFAQRTDDVLATATGMTFRLRDLSPETQKDVADLPVKIPKARLSLLEQLVSRRVFDAEAKARGITMGKLLADEKAKVKDPSDAEIQKVFDANADKLAELSPENARKQVISFLRNGPEQKLLGDLYTQLKIKYKVTSGKDVNVGTLAPTDTVATVDGKPITGKEFEDWVRVPLYEARADMADVILDELDELIYNTLVTNDAKSQGLDSSALIAREVSNKMKDFTDEERMTLEMAFRSSLSAKYKVKILYSEPEAPLENISVDDDPASGPSTAPVTVIMFSDFQCSACAATHPALKKAIEQFPGKVRFVVRDFPLESIHENAFAAARAANAANAQGKFFEYTEILYKNQGALDAASLKRYATQVGLNAAQFDIDFNAEKAAAEIRKDVADGEAYGINSTPTIFVNGRRVRRLSVDGFVQAIQKSMPK